MTESAASVASTLGWTHVGRCGGGEFGAHEVVRGAERAVLKVWDDPLTAAEVGRSVALAAGARERGELVPEYLDVGVVDGVSYTLQRFVEGALPSPLTLAHAQQLADLLDAHLGAATGVAYTRPRWWQNWDPTPTFAKLTGRAGALADELADLPSADDLSLGTDDVVHGDYHHRNLLVVGERVVAVFDWEGAYPGDRRADLFKLGWWSAAVTDQVEPAASKWLRRRVEDTIADDRTLTAFAADVARWNLDFYGRVHPEVLDTWFVDAAERYLAPLWRA